VADGVHGHRRGESDIAALDHGNEVAQSQRLEDKAERGAAMAHLWLISAVQRGSDWLLCPRPQLGRGSRAGSERQLVVQRPRLVMEIK
jgi:hypothetical protein